MGQEGIFIGTKPNLGLFQAGISSHHNASDSQLPWYQVKMQPFIASLRKPPLCIAFCVLKIIKQFYKTKKRNKEKRERERESPQTYSHKNQRDKDGEAKDILNFMGCCLITFRCRAHGSFSFPRLYIVCQLDQRCLQRPVDFHLQEFGEERELLWFALSFFTFSALTSSDVILLFFKRDGQMKQIIRKSISSTPCIVSVERAIPFKRNDVS